MNLVVSLETKFEDVYERNVDNVYRICYMYVLQKSDAEDLTQSTFIKYLNKKPTFENLSHEKAWFSVVATNNCKNHFKTWWNKNTSSLLTDEFFDSTSDNSYVLECVLSLPTKYKQIVYMYYYMGYTTREISSLISINESTVRTHLSKARSLLKDKIGSEL